MASDPELIFYYAPQSRAVVVRWMLEELGVPYHVHRLDLQAGDQKRADYLAVNPMGKVPAIRHRGVVVTEAAAICCYLADAYPQAGLAPAIGDPRRGSYLRWLMFSPCCIEPAVWDRALQRESGPAGMIGYGDFDTVMAVAAEAVGGEGPYLLGEQFTAADVVMGSMLRFGMMWGQIPERPEFVTYTGRLTERPAFKRSEALNAQAQEEG